MVSPFAILPFEFVYDFVAIFPFINFKNINKLLYKHRIYLTCLIKESTQASVIFSRGTKKAKEWIIGEER